MAKADEFSLDEAIRGTEAIIREVEGFDLEGKIADYVRREEFAAMEWLEQVPEEAHVEVHVAKDEMSAAADFYPGAESRPPLSLADVERAVAAKGISSGVDWPAVQNAILTCNTERVPIQDLVIALGKPARDEVPARLVIEPSLLEKPQAAGPADLSVDYKAISPFRLVAKGQTLARLMPRQEGELGYTVKGEALPFRKVVERQIEAGSNTVLEGETVLAACDGHFVVQADGFWVNKVLEVPGDVDYSTGNIDFPGDVIIHGEVKQGFTVRSGGGIYCEKVIDVSAVSCRNDLVTRQGLIGRKNGVVRAGGSVTAKFIENCFVEAKGQVRIQTGCLNSLVHSLDRVETGPKGVIVGGRIYAQNGISTSQLGTAAGPKTEIFCGINVFVQQKLLWIRDKNIALATRLKEVQSRLASDPKRSPKLAELQDRLRSAIHKLNEAAKKLINELDKNDRAEVRVTGTVFPGAFIEICHVPFIVGERLAGVRFSLDKKKGRIVVDPIL